MDCMKLAPGTGTLDLNRIFEEEKEKSSRYGLYVLGYSFATKAKTIGYNREI